MVAGLNLHQVSLNIVHLGGGGVTPKQALDNALADARGKETAYQAARQAKRNATLAQAAARKSAAEFSLRARDVLKPFLGRSWNEGWSAAGFTNQTLTLPGTMAGVSELVRALRDYFASHSPQESFNANVSSAVAAQQWTALQAAIGTVNNCVRDQRDKRDARAASEKVLLRSMGKLVSELDAALEPTDVRWLDFVNALPADTQTPEAVENLEVEGDGPGRLEAEWTPSVRAARYHVEVQEVGRDIDFRRAVTVTDPSAELEDLSPGTRVRVRVLAVNRAGESVPSEVVEAQVPALASVA
jgi:hypothetical protein